MFEGRCFFISKYACWRHLRNSQAILVSERFINSCSNFKLYYQETDKRFQSLSYRSQLCNRFYSALTTVQWFARSSKTLLQPLAIITPKKCSNINQIVSWTSQITMLTSAPPGFLLQWNYFSQKYISQSTHRS